MTLTFFAILRSHPLKLWSTTDLVREVERLEAEAEHLQHAVASHATIDQAIGAVVALGQIPPEEAWRALRDVSQRTNTKLRIVAEHVLSYAQGADSPEAVRDELHKAVIRYGGTARGPLR